MLLEIASAWTVKKRDHRVKNGITANSIVTKCSVETKAVELVLCLSQLDSALGVPALFHHTFSSFRFHRVLVEVPRLAASSLLLLPFHEIQCIHARLPPCCWFGSWYCQHYRRHMMPTELCVMPTKTSSVRHQQAAVQHSSPERNQTLLLGIPA